MGALATLCVTCSCACFLVVLFCVSLSVKISSIKACSLHRATLKTNATELTGFYEQIFPEDVPIMLEQDFVIQMKLADPRDHMKVFLFFSLYPRIRLHAPVGEGWRKTPVFCGSRAFPPSFVGVCREGGRKHPRG